MGKHSLSQAALFQRFSESGVKDQGKNVGRGQLETPGNAGLRSLDFAKARGQQSLRSAEPFFFCF